MDGSAAPFIYLIQEAGVKSLQVPRQYLKIVRPIAISRGDKRIALYPSDHFKVTYSISYDHPLLRHQSRTIRITEETFAEEVAPARTFTFLKDVEMLRQNGLALGGSLDNAIVLGETGVLNNALRFEDEFVRHKILDAVGDLALNVQPASALTGDSTMANKKLPFEDVLRKADIRRRREALGDAGAHLTAETMGLREPRKGMMRL